MGGRAGSVIIEIMPREISRRGREKREVGREGGLNCIKREG